MCTLGDCNWPSLKLILILVVFRPSGVEFSIFMGLGLIRKVLGFPLFSWVNFTSSTMLGAGKTYLFFSSLIKTFFSAISCDRRLTNPIFLSLGDLGLLKIQKNKIVNKQLKCITCVFTKKFLNICSQLPPETEVKQKILIYVMHYLWRLTTLPGKDLVLVIEVDELKDVFDDLNEEFALCGSSRLVFFTSSSANSSSCDDKSWFAVGKPKPGVSKKIQILAKLQNTIHFRWLWLSLIHVYY